MNIVTKIRVNLCLLSYSWLTRTVLSRLLKKAVSMALWTKVSLCVKSSLSEQSVPRTPSRPKSSVISVAKNLCNLWLLFRAYKAPGNWHLSTVLGHSTTVEDSLQISSFMQNKANLLDAQMNVSIFLQMTYENKSNRTLGENKPNSNPNKPNSRKAKMNVNLTLTKDYRKKDDFSVRINKPNFVKCPKWT